MPRAKKANTKSAKWYERLDQDAIKTAFEEAAVDANGEDEQLTGLFYAMDEEMTFPWQGSVLGETVSVVGIEIPNNDRLAIDLVVERNGKQSRIEARSVDVLSPLPDGHLFLAAYLKWKERF